MQLGFHYQIKVLQLKMQRHEAGVLKVGPNPIFPPTDAIELPEHVLHPAGPGRGPYLHSLTVREAPALDLLALLGSESAGTDPRNLRGLNWDHAVSWAGLRFGLRFVLSQPSPRQSCVSMDTEPPSGWLGSAYGREAQQEHNVTSASCSTGPVALAPTWGC